MKIIYIILLCFVITVISPYYVLALKQRHINIRKPIGVFSNNRHYCAIKDEKRQATVIYFLRKSPSSIFDRKISSAKPIWKIDTIKYYVCPSDNGAYAVVLIAPNLPIDYKGDPVLFEFYKKGRLINKIHLSILFTHPKRLTAGGATTRWWGNIIGIDNKTLSLVVYTCENLDVWINLDSGKVVRRIKDKDKDDINGKVLIP